MGLLSAGDVTHRKRVEDLGRFWKSQWVEMRHASGEDGWFSLARGDLCGGCHTSWGGRWKSQNRKIVPLSLYVEEPLNSKVIKSFVPEQRSRYVFFEFRDSYVLSLWTFDVRFTHSHIMAMVHLSYSGRERPSFWERLRKNFFGLLPIEFLTATTLSGHLAVNFLPDLGFSAILLRLFTDQVF